jgi:predicted adenine nucleotide alpha hydrolase (AANH) superfamily ATPase
LKEAVWNFAAMYLRAESTAGERVIASTLRYLEARSRLQINEAKSSVTQPEKVHFLGFRFGTDDGPNVEVLISAKTKVKLNTRIVELSP